MQNDAVIRMADFTHTWRRYPDGRLYTFTFTFTHLHYLKIEEKKILIIFMVFL